MRSHTFVRALGLAFILGLAACGGIALSTDGGAGADGAGAHAGSEGGAAAGNGGSTGLGGAGGHAGAGGAAGTITLQLAGPTGKSFCDQMVGCGAVPTHITILANGQPLTIGTPPCSTVCSTCRAPICPAYVCAAPHGVAFTGGEVTWDGTVYAMSTCGTGTTCYASSHAPAGTYVARMCATPGTLSTPDGGSTFASTCTASGPAACVDVSFQYPGPTPVVGHLP